MGFAASRAVKDADYLLHRAAAEAEAAELAGSQRSAEAHHSLASAYLDLVFGAQEARAAAAQAAAEDARRESRQALSAPFKMLKPVDGTSGFTDLLIRLG